MSEISLGLTRVAVHPPRAFSFCRQELDDIGNMVILTKTVALPPKGYTPMLEDISLLGIVDFCIADEGGVTVADVPIGTDECMLER